MKKRIEVIEKELSNLETQIIQIQEMMADPDHYEDNTRVKETIEKHRQLKDTIESLTTEWEGLSLEVEVLQEEFEQAKEQMGL